MTPSRESSEFHFIGIDVSKKHLDLHAGGTGKREQIERAQKPLTVWLAKQPGELHVVVEATGRAEGFELALEATRPRGTLVLKSTVAEHPQVDLAPLVVHEIQLLGSRCGPFEPALQALGEGSVDVTSLVEERLPLARADEALRRAARPGALKVLVEVAVS